MQNFTENADLFYELSKHLTVRELRKLCVIDQKYRKICQTERFQQLFRKRIQQEKELVYNIIDNILEGKIFEYNIKAEDHILLISAIGYEFFIRENINYSKDGHVKFNKSLLYKLYPYNTSANNRNTYTRFDIRNVTAIYAQKLLNMLISRDDFKWSKIHYRD